MLILKHNTKPKKREKKNLPGGLQGHRSLIPRAGGKKSDSHTVTQCCPPEEARSPHRCPEVACWRALLSDCCSSWAPGTSWYPLSAVLGWTAPRWRLPTPCTRPVGREGLVSPPAGKQMRKTEQFMMWCVRVAYMDIQTTRSHLLSLAIFL